MNKGYDKESVSWSI